MTGGAGFIGGIVVRRLLAGSDAQVFNLDKCNYTSDLIESSRQPAGDCTAGGGGGADWSAE